MKKIVATLASLALVLAANFGLASAHPFAEPTPPTSPKPHVNTTAPAAPSATETDVEQEGDEQDVDMNETDVDTTDVKETDGDNNDSDEDAEDADDADDEDDASTAPATTTTTTGNDKHGHQDKHGHDHERGESEGDD